jgi:hypothetical protein
LSCFVRAANINDLDEILVHLKEFAKFYKSKKSLYGEDEQFSSNLIKGFIENHVFFVAVRDDKVVGFICGIVLPHAYNPKISTLTELFWWVQEDARSSRAGTLLLNEFIDYGKKNVDWIICTLEDDSPVSDSTFLKRGFRLKERSFLLEVQ